MILRYWIAPFGFLCFVGLSAIAETTQVTRASDVLKNLSPVGTMCAAESTPANNPSPPKSIEKVVDMACAISVADAREFLSRAESVVVDTRSAVEYSAFHVDGALNISEQALRTKTFLQSKPIVLAGNGKGEHELYAACGDLKRAGFKQVRVLRGGMPAWLNALSPVMGTVVPVPPMLRLTSAQLMVEAAFDENLILISPQMRTVQKLLPTATSLASSNPEAVAKATKDLLVRRGKQAKGMVSSSVVLVADATINDEYIDQLSKLLKPSPLLVYTDGADLLKQFVRGQEAMWKSYAQGPQKPKCKL